MQSDYKQSTARRRSVSPADAHVFTVDAHIESCSMREYARLLVVSAPVYVGQAVCCGGSRRGHHDLRLSTHCSFQQMHWVHQMHTDSYFVVLNINNVFSEEYCHVLVLTSAQAHDIFQGECTHRLSGRRPAVPCRTGSLLWGSRGDHDLRLSHCRRGR
jgi:hypothetical protein